MLNLVALPLDTALTKIAADASMSAAEKSACVKVEVAACAYFANRRDRKLRVAWEAANLELLNLRTH